MLFGCCRTGSFFPSISSAQTWRAAAKLCPGSAFSRLRTSSVKPGAAISSAASSSSRSRFCATGGPLSASASFSSGSPLPDRLSPVSQPKDRTSAPRSARIDTAPSAKPSAEERTHGSGSSTTRSAPLRQAASARAYLENTAASPRWTKSPLMTATTVVSSPSASTILRLSRICRACPR